MSSEALPTGSTDPPKEDAAKTNADTKAADADSTSKASSEAAKAKPTPPAATDTKTNDQASEKTADTEKPVSGGSKAPATDAAKSQAEKSTGKPAASEADNESFKSTKAKDLMTLWKEFQAAEKQHMDRIKHLELRLHQAEKTVEHFGKFCGEYHLLWKVKDFRRCYEEAASEMREIVYSPAFDTHRNGYRLQLSICPVGDGKGRGLAMSVFFAILKGPSDSLLDWPFKCPVTIGLLDQSHTLDKQDTENPEAKPRDVVRTFCPNPRPENAPFLGRPTENRNMSLGFPKFVLLQDLFDGRFIREDAIYFKVHVDISGLIGQQQQQ